MCAEEPLFSLTPVYHFLSLHPSSLQSATSCPSLLPSEVPPAPSGTAQDFTLSLRNVQEVQQTTLSRIDAPGLGPECVLWKWLESSRSIWCVHFKLGYTQMDIWVVQFGSMNVQNWSFWELKALRDRSENSSPFSAVAQLPGPHTSDAIQQEAELCDRQHTVQNATCTAGALMLRCWP